VAQTAVPDFSVTNLLNTLCVTLSSFCTPKKSFRLFSVVLLKIVSRVFHLAISDALFNEIFPSFNKSINFCGHFSHQNLNG
jgi:hypothetical protein